MLHRHTISTPNTSAAWLIRQSVGLGGPRRCTSNELPSDAGPQALQAISSKRGVDLPAGTVVGTFLKIRSQSKSTGTFTFKVNF